MPDNERGRTTRTCNYAQQLPIHAAVAALVLVALQVVSAAVPAAPVGTLVGSKEEREESKEELGESKEEREGRKEERVGRKEALGEQKGVVDLPRVLPDSP